MVTRYWYEYEKPSDTLQSLYNESYVSDRQVVGYISPSGRISVGRLPAPKVLVADEEYERTRPHTEYYKQKHWDAFEGIISEDKIISDDPPALGLSAVPNHHEAKPRRYGLRGITSNGKSRVYEGAKVLESRYGTRLGFYTLTCPYKDCSLIYEFNRNIGEITRRWFQTLRRFYESVGCTFSYVSVTELQTERYEKRGEWVLHIHYIAPCYYPGTARFILSSDGIRYLWMCECAGVLGIEADTSASVDSQVVEKSASGYLAKYVSKGSGDIEFVADIAQSQCPRQWWSMSANVRRVLQRCTQQMPQPIAEWYFEGGGKQDDGSLRLNYRRDIMISWQGQELKVGMTGQVCRDGLLLLRNNSVYAISLLFV
jgi:hypothetical protein